MKSILGGTWPPLKPLPVFKYETAEYRATIDFDKKRGEWVCRKTSLPSNEVQELRGGLREISLALPHGEAETFAEGVEQPEAEFERETNRRLHAIRDWREKNGNGARYYELREFLSERQRTELEDSLRLTLTARQLQFNPKNVADVFEDLSVAGGRFAALLEFAKGKQASQGIVAPPEADGTAPETESAPDEDEKSLEINPPAFGGILHNDEPLIPVPEAAERLPGTDEFPAAIAHTASQPFEIGTSEIVDVDSPPDADEFPAVSIKDVFPEKDELCLPERTAHAALQQFATEDFEIADADSGSLVEPADQEARYSPALTGHAARVPKSQTLASGEGADHIEGSRPRFAALKISAFQANVLAILALFAVTSFTVGLTVGRGPLGKRLQEPPKLIVANEATPPAPADPLVDRVANQEDEATPRTSVPPVASTAGSVGADKPDAARPTAEKAEVKPEESRGSEPIAEGQLPDSDSSPPTESKPSVQTERSSEPIGAIAPIVGNVPPPASSKPLHARKAVGGISSAPRRLAPYRPNFAIPAPPHLSTASTILVTAPGQGSEPLRVRFLEKTVAATSSLAMTSQLSVLVPPEPAFAAAHKSARLEAGELVSFVWPRYSGPGHRYGLAQTISVRATIGQLGQVLEVKFLGGSTSLLPATTGAIRQWRYRPTLLDKRPVEAQQDITIEFRPPPQYSSQLRTQHPPRN